jgi:hypothetical protein
MLIRGCKHSGFLVVITLAFAAFMGTIHQAVAENPTDNVSNKMGAYLRCTEGIRDCSIKNAVEQISGEKTQQSLRLGINAMQVRLAREKGTHTREFREVLNKIRNRGDVVLLADRIKPKNVRSLEHIRKLRDLRGVIPQKPDTAPLDIMKPCVERNCRRSVSMEDLREKIRNEVEAGIRERDLLLLAGYLVGQDDWDGAKEIYEKLEANSNDPGVISAAQRNLEVTNRKLAILVESDPNRKEKLELDLANLHRDFGHDQAAKRIYHHLAKTANEAGVQSQAMKALSVESKPGRCPIPVAFRKTATD